MTSTTLDTLGQSLNYWQVLYIIAISLALISTFSIVYFAFHREHRVALRSSNYLYVVASLLAVISTIVIVVKTRAIDAEKDRLLALALHADDVKIAASNERSEQLAQQNLLLSDRINGITGRLNANDAAKKTANRVIANGQRLARQLSGFRDVQVAIQWPGDNAEATIFQRQLIDVFTVSGIVYDTGEGFGTLGGMLNPENVPGVHLRYSNNEHAKRVADILASALKANGILYTETPATPSDQVITALNEAQSRQLLDSGKAYVWMTLGPAK